MPNNAEIAKNAIDDFKKIQDYMAVAKEENATKTYAKLCLFDCHSPSKKRIFLCLLTDTVT